MLLGSSIAFPSMGTSAAAGDTDTALVLDGTARYATAPDSTVLKNMNAISIEFWFKSSLSTCSGNIVSKGIDYVVYCTNGVLAYAFQSAGTGATGTDIQYPATTKVYKLIVPQNEWHHFAITREANTNAVTTYWDGQVVNSAQGADGAVSSALRQTSSPLNIGARNNTTTYFSGVIDEVRISNVVRTKSEIQTNMNTWGIGSQTGVVAYYDFNDVSGSTILDRVGSSNLTLVGSPSTMAIESSTVVSGDQVVIFPRTYLNSNGGWRVPAGVTKIQSLVVAGGGGGGSRAGGGGGAGGYVATELATLTFTPNSIEAITVGQGGSVNAAAQGTNGFNSSLGSKRIALGGGGGGGAVGTGNTQRVGLDGGSGGGASGANGGGLNSTNSAQFGYGKQLTNYGYGTGFNGAYTQGDVAWNAGGGGGSSASATIASSNAAGNYSAGGAGTSNSITGVLVCYATGGGGGGGVATANTSGYGGNGGDCGGTANINGGRGTFGKLSAYAGAANTGAGGGGSGWDDGVTGSDAPGGNGGSGIVVLRYLVNLTTSFSGVSTATYRQNSTISVTTSIPARITFYSNGKRISGCISISTVNLVASCIWKPSVRGNITLSAVTTPLNTAVPSATDRFVSFVAKRSGSR